MIKPTINGLLDIMKACLKAKTVRRLIFTSSAATLNNVEHEKRVVDETCWTDIEFCRRAKMTGWVSTASPSFFSTYRFYLFIFRLIADYYSVIHKKLKVYICMMSTHIHKFYYQPLIFPCRDLPSSSQ